MKNLKNQTISETLQDFSALQKNYAALSFTENLVNLNGIRLFSALK